MALFPRIQSPCPYKGDLSAIMDGEVCRLCKREVFDLSGMSDAERVAFLGACAGEVCVKYSFPVRATAAAALAAAAVAMPMAAAAAECEEITIIVGGIKDPANVEYVSTADADVPELPVIYESAGGAAAGGQGPAVQGRPQQSPGSEGDGAPAPSAPVNSRPAAS